MRNLFFLSVAVIAMTGCAATRMHGVRTNAPAAYLMVPQPMTFYSQVTPGGRGDLIAARREPVAEAKAGACAAGMTVAHAEKPIPGIERKPAYLLPAGKYVLVAEDKVGFYYQAPGPIRGRKTTMDQTGGIYWDKMDDLPRFIYLKYGDEDQAEVDHEEAVSREVIIPPKTAGRAN